MKLSDLAYTLRSIPSDFSNSTVKQLRTYASRLRISASVRTKESLIAELKSHLSDLKTFLSDNLPAPTPATLEPPARIEETTFESSSSTPDNENIFVDTARLLISGVVSDTQRRLIAKRRLELTETSNGESQIFLYLNSFSTAVALADVANTSVFLSDIKVEATLTLDKTQDIAMTAEDFKSGKYFPGFKLNKRDRQWEHTDSNGIKTRIYDKTAELLQRGADSPQWYKGKMDNYDKGTSYALHTVRFEARHTSIAAFKSTPLHVPQEALDHETSQTYVNASSEVVSRISLAIKTKIKLKLEELINSYFAALHRHFSLGSRIDNRFAELKSALKKLHPELAPELAKIRLKK